MRFIAIGIWPLLTAFVLSVFAGQSVVLSDENMLEPNEILMPSNMPLALLNENAVTALQEAVNGPACTGDGCDAYLPMRKYVFRYHDVGGQRRLNSLLGGVAGSLIGDEAFGAPGAVALGALGIVAGYHMKQDSRWEDGAKQYRAAWQRGDDISYNPAHRIPYEPHWMQMGPASAKKK